MRYGNRLMTFATGLIAIRRRGRMTVVLLLTLTIIRSSLAQEDFSPEMSTPAASANSGIPRVTPDVPNVRLNHVSATWESVLNQLAEDAGCTLILHDVPRGRYSRRDWRKHTPTEAVRILNQQLEPLGYRILMKDQFLTVIQIDRTRVEYPSYEVPATEPAPQARIYEPGDGPGRNWLDANDAGGFRPIGNLSRDAGAQIIQVAGEEAGPEDEAPEAAPEQPIETQRVVTQHPASEIAGQLFEAFRDRARLMKIGPTGLPAFQAYREPLDETQAVFGEESPVDQPVWFLVEVDGRSNSLNVQAATDTVGGVRTLIRQLDVPRRNPEEAVRVVIDAGEDVESLANQLNREMEKVRRDGRHLALAQQPADPAAQSPAPQDEQTVPLQGTEFSGLIGTLRGDVTIEALPELDLLILRGNEEDVAAVMAMINQIEQLAAGAAPSITLKFLHNVDSEALAELLNEVYDALVEVSGSSTATRQTRPVTFVAVGNPNAIVILAPQNSVVNIEELVDLLDVPVPAGTEVQVFRLRNAIASQVVTTLTNFYADRPGLGTEIRVVPDVRTNSVIVNARPNELAEVRKLVRQIDRDSPRGVVKMLPIHLEYALADELSDFLNTMVQSILNPAQTPTGQGGGFGAGGQAAQELRDTRSVVLEYLKKDQNAQRLVRSGMLSDVRFNADLRTNTLFVTAPEASLDFFKELVKVLDQPTSTVADIKVFPLKNTDAQAAADLLQTLFPAQEEGELGVQVAGAEGGASGLIPLQLSVDTRSNSVIAIGSREVLDVVGAILFKLDSAEQLNRETQVIRLHNNPAFDISDAVNQYLQSQRDLLQLDPDRISTSQVLEQEIIVTPEPISNSLIISATPRYIQSVLDLVQQLDREPEQVMIQAMIVEVTLEDTDEFGVELGFQDSLLFDRSVILQDGITTINQTMQNASGVSTTSQQIISQSATPGFLFNNSPLGNNTLIHPSGVGSQGLSSFNLGRTNEDLGFGGLVLSASSEAVSVLIRALSLRRDVNILSRPQVLALDNQVAQVQVGQRVPIVNGFNPPTATFAATPLIDYDSAGVILTVTPRISPDGQVVMEVAAEKSQYTSGVPIYTDVNTGAVIESPVKDITTAVSTVKVPDGQTIVLGGMITKTDETIERKVPWLGDLPIVGNIFGYDFHNHRRTELLIFLTPRVIHNDADSELIKQIEMGRLHWFEDEGEMIHGPLMSIPAPQSTQPTIVPPEQHTEENGEMNSAPHLVPPLPENGDARLRPMSGTTFAPQNGVVRAAR